MPTTQKITAALFFAMVIPIHGIPAEDSSTNTRVCVASTDCPSNPNARNPAQIPESLRGEPWVQINKQIQTDQHRMRLNEGVWASTTPAQQYKTHFLKDGPVVTIQANGKKHAIGFQLKGVSVDEQPLPLDAAETFVNGNRLEYQRGNVTEWYVNNPTAMEQGFTIDDAPPGDQLNINLDLNSDLIASVTTNQLHMSDQELLVFRYAGLMAWDSEGTHLAANIALYDDILSLQVDVRGAHYPVTVDPVMFNEAARLLPDFSGFGSDEDFFGASVSVDGDRALVGAPGSDDDGRTDNGEAFIFDLDNGSWLMAARLVPENSGNDDQFGWAVSLSGDRALVSAIEEDSNGADAGAVYVFELIEDTWIEVDKLVSDDGAPFDKFGQAVSLSGDRALIGSSFDDDNGSNSGSAYIFDLIGGEWTQVDKVVPSDGAISDLFGNSVSVSGDRALIGASSNDTNGDNSGAAYLFELVGGNWIQVVKLLPDDGEANDLFGGSVSLSGDFALVGATGDGDNGENAGAVYVYELIMGNWEQADKLLADDGSAGDRFGWSVSLSGSRALVSAAFDMSASGSAYLFERVAGNWIQADKIRANDATSSDLFGASVSLSGSRVFIGKQWDDDFGFQSGAAYIFEPNGAVWEQDAKLTSGNGAAHDEFGVSVSMSNGRALIGARGDDEANSDAGAAYVFESIGDSWIRVAKLTASDGGFGDQFGQSVSLSNNRALVGAYLDKDNGLAAGSAYIFELIGDTWTEVAKLLPDDGSPDDQFGISVSLSGTRALVGARFANGVSTATGAAYVFEPTGDDWLQVEKLFADDGDGSDQFGYNVSLFGNRALIGAHLDDDVVSNSGSAYVFRNDASLWLQEAKLKPTDVSETDFFGVAVSLGENLALVGAPFDDDNGSGSGSAYLFERTGTTWTELVKLLPDDGASGARFGSAVSLFENRALVSNRASGATKAAYLFESPGGEWTQVAELQPQSGTAIEFGITISLFDSIAIIGAPRDNDGGTQSGSAYIFEEMFEIPFLKNGFEK